MPQFDVHRNPGRNREEVPFVVVVQSASFDAYPRRVVVPLIRRGRSWATLPRLTPTFTVQGTVVSLNPLDIVSLPIDALGKPIASLVEHGPRIIDAIDEVLTSAYG